MMVNSREEFLDVRLEFYPLCLIERPFFADSVVNTLPLLRKDPRLPASVGLDTRFFRIADCRESALDLLMLYRHPDG